MEKIDKIEIVKGSVVNMETDAIVNAANNSLLGGGGVDGAIHNAAGPELLEECKKLYGCKTGEAKITKAYRLKAHYVIHTVGPIYSGVPEDAELLASCYRNCMDLASEYKLGSISFCGISTGVYGYPLGEAVNIALSTVASWFAAHPDADIQVFFCCYSDKEYAAYRECYEILFEQ